MFMSVHVPIELDGLSLVFITSRHIQQAGPFFWAVFNSGFVHGEWKYFRRYYSNSRHKLGYSIASSISDHLPLYLYGGFFLEYSTGNLTCSTPSNVFLY
jgi:hypothetical protein